MVVRLEGLIDGVPVIFNRKEGDRWETVFPRNLNGIYIVELTAYDEAGNVGYTTKYIITIDLSAMCVHLMEYPYYAVLVPERYEVEARLSRYYSAIRPRACDFCVAVSLSPYYASLMKTECEGG